MATVQKMHVFIVFVFFHLTAVTGALKQR